MAAGVSKCTHNAVVTTDRDQGRSRRNPSHIGAFFRQRRGGAIGDRQPSQQLNLSLKPRNGSIILRRFPPDTVAEIRRVVVDMAENAFDRSLSLNNSVISSPLSPNFHWASLYLEETPLSKMCASQPTPARQESGHKPSLKHWTYMPMSLAWR